MTAAETIESGCAFIIGVDPAASPVFTPEQLPEDARAMARAVEQFVRAESQNSDAMPRMLHAAGEMGLLGIGVPEEFGGINLPKSQAALLAETTGINPSFAISCGVHSGVATLPILYFGTPEQRARWLPKLASGEWIGAFALTEAEAGSDALNTRTRAALTPDKRHYVLNGSKMWITNGAFADLFTVFARVEDAGFTAFVVERGAQGLSIGREEHKLGLKGSSTVRLTFDDVKVPVDQVLGEAGKGHHPALYSLNLGRLALSAVALGMSKENLKLATAYAKQRVQFGRPIVEFGMIRQKLARMAVRILTAESMLYRTAGCIDRHFAAHDILSDQREYRQGSEEYATECSILKIMTTETLDFTADESLQIHGGYGYSEEYPAAQAYRDSRVFRIFEGTNEINRLNVVEQILKRAKSGRIALGTASDGIADRSGAIPTPKIAEISCRLAGVSGITNDSDEAQQLRRGVEYIRVAALAANLIAEGGGHKIEGRHCFDVMRQQEIVGVLADMFGELYAADSLYHRCRSAKQEMLVAAQVYIDEAAMRCWLGLRTVLAFRSTPEYLTIAAAWLQALLPPLTDTLTSQELIAELVSEREAYPW